MAPGDLTRFAIGVDASTLETGTYDWELELKTGQGVNERRRYINGAQSIVNRNNSPFGKGWWLEGIDGVLAKLQADAGSSSHFFSRHGAQTSIGQQFDRATTGLTPDGFAGNIVDSSRFLSHRSQLNAFQAAEEIFGRTGKKVFTFDAGYEIGEGFTRNATDLVRTTNLRAVFFANGKITTLFPWINPLP